MPSRYNGYATGWRPWSRDAIPGKAGGSSLLKSVQTGSLAYPSTYSVGIGGPFPGAKAAGA
jgi:hypothetical protein